MMWINLISFASGYAIALGTIFLIITFDKACKK